jgi:hypothetical protein
MPYQLMQPRFPLGRIFATPGAIALNVDLARYLRRHHCGDWGDELCAEDKQANEHSLKDGTRLLSRYSTPGGSIYIITEHDRSVTTILLPEEY